MNPEQDTRRSGTTASGSSMKPGGGSRTAGQAGPGQGSATGGAGGEMGSRIGETAKQVGESAKQAGAKAQRAAGSLGSRTNEQARRLADRQLSMGAEIIGDVADAVRTAAERLDRNEPQIAQLARGAADRIEDFSDTIRGQSAEELWHASADFARRRPAMLFGATAGLGFLLFRLLKTGSSRNFGDGTTQRDFDWDRPDYDRPGGHYPAAGTDAGMRDRQPRGGPGRGA